MTSRKQVTPAEYLSTPFDNPAPEYVRGEIVERATPDLRHSLVQPEVGSLFLDISKTHHLFPCLSVTLRLAEDLYRIPDVAVFDQEPNEEIPSKPPLVAVEIISPEDRASNILRKLAEYDEWGIPNIWVVDPARRTFATYHSGALTETPRLTLPGYPIEIGPELFS